MTITTRLCIEYAHRFWKHPGEAQYLHGHHGELTAEVAGTADERGFVKPVKDIQGIIWDVMQNFDHALLLQEGDPLMEAILGVYEKQGIKNGDKDNTQRGTAFKCALGYAVPESRLVVTKKISTCENMVELFHELLKDKLTIKSLRFQSNARNLIAAKQDY
ncbi:MAG: 6-carboxytetrahydropterin synthase [Treponema sp.]|jgi:6-pyruvoyltetrahydropterin/6-carboxytetrahydropterin synthase|nr:6-carboxytetrahydropterin synthase [Treponema sp.]